MQFPRTIETLKGDGRVEPVDLESTVEVSAPQERVPLSLLLVSDQDYKIMGRVGIDFFGNYDEGRMFNPLYSSKQDVLAALNKDRLVEANVILFNLVCSEESLDHPMKFGLLERLIKANPTSFFITPVNYNQHSEILRPGGDYEQEWANLKKMLKEPGLLSPYRLPGESLQLSREDDGEYQDYFKMLIEEYKELLSGFWDEISQKRSYPTAIVPVKGANATHIRDLSKTVGCKVESNVDLNDFTTIKIGGHRTDAVVYPTSLEDLQTIIKFCRDRETSYWFLGNGSNVVLADKIPGFVIATGGMNSYELDRDQATITAQCGAPLFGRSNLVSAAYNNSLSGLEYSVNIPSRIGGLVAMNASYRMARGEEMTTASIVKLVRALNPDGDVVELTPDQLDFKYKYSIFQSALDWMVYEVVLQLEEESQSEINDKMRAITHDRFSIKKQPHHKKFPSAGSVFRLSSPYVTESGATFTASECIVNAGCLDLNRPGSPLQLYEPSPNFIINMGGATFSNFRRLINEIYKQVHKELGVELELEVKTLPYQKMIRV